MRRVCQRSAAAFLVSLAGLILGGLMPIAASAQSAASVSLADSVLTVHGQTSPDAYVTVRLNGGVIGTVTADSAGLFVESYPAQTPGISQLSFSASDTDGLATDLISMNVNIQDHDTTGVSVFLPTSLSLSAASMTGGQTLRVYGRTLPGASVVLNLDGQTIGTAAAGGQGEWQYVLSTAGLPVGTHSFFGAAIDGSGSQSYPTGPHTFVVQSGAFMVLPVPDPSLIAPVALRLAVPVIRQPADGSTIAESPVILSGTGPSATQIIISENGRDLGSVWSGGQGSWKLNTAVQAGRHTVQARACSGAVCGVSSNPVTFTYQPKSAVQQPLQGKLQNYAVTAVPGDKVVLPLSISYGTPPYKITTNWGDGTSQTTVAAGSQAVLQHAYSHPGHFEGNATIMDSSGSVELLFTVNVRYISNSSDRTPEILFVVLAFALCLIAVRPFLIRYIQRGAAQTEKAGAAWGKPKRRRRSKSR